uniref:IENR2 domain-containing protein n=1 Tax=Caenorhabditis tropicalis TaxID=1561998 RepID=A0A1I7UCG9_9PELO
MPSTRNQNRKPQARHIDELSKNEIDEIDEYILDNQVLTNNREEMQKISKTYNLAWADTVSYVGLVIRTKLKPRSTRMTTLNKKYFKEGGNKANKPKSRNEKMEKCISKNLTKENMKTIEKLCKKEGLTTFQTTKIRNLSERMNVPVTSIEFAIIVTRKKMMNESKGAKCGLFTIKEAEELRKDLEELRKRKENVHWRQRMKENEKVAAKYGKSWIQIKQWIQSQRQRKIPDFVKIRKEEAKKRYLETNDRCKGLDGRKRAEENEEIISNEPQHQINIKRDPKKKSSLKVKKDKSLTKNSVVFAEEDDVCDNANVENVHSSLKKRKRKRSKSVETEFDTDEQSSLKERDQSSAKRPKRCNNQNYDEDYEMDSYEQQGPSSSGQSSSHIIDDEEDMSDYYEDDEFQELDKDEEHRDSDEEVDDEQDFYGEDSDEEEEDAVSSFEPLDPREVIDEDEDEEKSEDEEDEVSPPSSHFTEPKEAAPTDESRKEEEENPVKENRNERSSTSNGSSYAKKVYNLKELIKLDLKKRKLLPKEMPMDCTNWTSEEVRRWASLFLDAKGMQLFNTLKINGSELLQFKSNDLEFFNKLVNDGHQINIYFYNLICNSLKQICNAEKNFIYIHKQKLQTLGIIPTMS